MLERFLRIVVFYAILLFSDILIVFSEVHVISYTPPKQCDADKYYDIAKLSCELCATGEQSAFQSADFSGNACKCKPGHRFVNYTSVGGLYCLPCPFPEVPTLDGLSCTLCDESNPYNKERGTCGSCSAGQVTVDRKHDGTIKARQCVACKSGTQADHFTGRCVPCRDPLLLGKNSCDCPANTHELVDGICFEKSDVVGIPDKESLYLVKYDTMELNSAYFCRNVRSAFAMCQIYHNASACQLLGNLCSLLYYRHIGEEMNACTKYLQLTEVSGGAATVQWPPKVPWLYYLSDSMEDTLHKKDIDTTYTFKKGSLHSRLNFTAASYTLEGHFLNLQSVNGEDWQLCPAPFDILNAAFQFGTRYRRSCKIPVRILWDKHKTVFYDPYLYYETSDKGPVLYAVPVLVQNYVENGKAVNRGPANQWKFFRRFYLVDNISGKSPCHNPSSVANILRYAKDLTIRIEMYRSSDASQIYAPLITVDYGEATLEDYQADREVEVSFNVEYKMDQSKEEKDFSIATGILCSFAIIISAVQTWSWSKRSGRLGIDFMTLINLLLHLCGNLATAFLIVTFCTCFYIFLFFKKQDAVYVVLPTEDQEFQFVILIVLAFFLKFVHLLHILVLRSMYDIFFVDWERPLARRTILHPKDGKLNGKEEREPSVSIWRTYLVANEWAELQSLRKCSIGLQILTTEFFLVVVGFENLASTDSQLIFLPSSSQYISPTNVTCRLAIGIAVFLVVAVVQILFVTFFYQQFIEDKIKQYVDLCSISNVSVFVMTAKQFGYYIHGRSVHGHADTDMTTMYEQLRREEDNLCSQRGLLPNSDHQTFEMALPLYFRLYYDQVMTPILQSSRIPGRMSTGNQGVTGNRNVNSETDRIIQAYQTMNRFLSSFLEHALRDLDYIVKEKSFVENILDIEFQDPTEKGYFYQDSGHSYDSCFLFGHEFTLIIFDLLLFISIDLAAQDFILAGIITFVIDKFIIFVYKIFSRSNLARKTLVDARFLI